MDGPPSLLHLEEELTCCICLSPFDHPVTLPCGHNFCQACLESTWSDSSYSCPQCRSFYTTKPELKKNTVLSTVVETFNQRASKSMTGLQHEEEKPEEEKHYDDDVILCDTCMQVEAAKTCLTCMASFCEKHLRPHLENPTFRLHQLSEPSGSLSERICPDHHKLMEHFCCQHGCLFCTSCLQQNHKECTFISPEEQRNLKESEFKEKLNLLNEKIQRTDKALLRMNHMDSTLKELAEKKKSELAVVYQQIREMLAQDEVLAQHQVDNELEIVLNKLHGLSKKFTGNKETMSKARENITDLLSQSRNTAFLQASYDLPRVVKFDAFTPRINLDSKRVTSVQEFVVNLKENLEKSFSQPFETRAFVSKQGENETPAPESAATEQPAAQKESVRQRPAEQRNKMRSKSPARPPSQPRFHRAPDASQFFNPFLTPGQFQNFPRAPPLQGQSWYKKGEAVPNPLHKFTHQQSDAGKQQPAPKGPDFSKPDKNYPPRKPDDDHTGMKH